MNYKLAVINTTSVGIEQVSNLLVIIGAGGFEVCDSEDFRQFLESREPAYDYIDAELEKLCSNRSCIKLYTADNAQGEDTLKRVESALTELKKTDSDNKFGTLEMSVSLVDDSDWVDNWKKYYKPMKIGRVTVAPAWENVSINAPVLKIDPGMAFGTGSHETTSLCIELLQTIELSGTRVLDVGCGSGILSQAAVILGADYATGCDIDEAAVTSARANAVLNGLENKTEYFKGDLLDGIRGRYENVVANIVADVIMSLTADIKSVIKSDGCFICSGIIAERLPEIKECLNKNGFVITDIRERRGWVAVKSRLR